MNNKFAKRVIREWLLLLTILGWSITSLSLWRFPHYSATDFKVIYTLFVFLVTIKGLESSGMLSGIAARLDRGRHLTPKLVIITGLLSMFITNDVALLTMVPLTLALDMDAKTIILETLVANGASALTPFGNPQNIFIYYHYHLHPLAFMKTIAPFALISFLLILLASFWREGRAPSQPLQKVKNPYPGKKGSLYLAFFLAFILAVLKLLPLSVGIIPLFYALFFDRECLHIDYLLLVTFLGFFGFTDNLMHILHFNLTSTTQVFVYSSLGSQIMSNAPSTLFFADFTNNWHALLWGVSVGGFGNLMGSLASLISYRFYKAHTTNQRDFLAKFHLYGYLAFFAGWVLYFGMRLLP